MQNYLLIDRVLSILANFLGEPFGLLQVSLQERNWLELVNQSKFKDKFDSQKLFATVYKFLNEICSAQGKYKSFNQTLFQGDSI
jgi:hypothetical protein